MIAYIVIGILLALMGVYLVLRKPVWLEQITPNGKTIYVCSHCGEIWRPIYYSDYQLSYSPPSKCPSCEKEMRTYR